MLMYVQVQYLEKINFHVFMSQVMGILGIYTDKSKTYSIQVRVKDVDYLWHFDIFFCIGNCSDWESMPSAHNAQTWGHSIYTCYFNKNI